MKIANEGKKNLEPKANYIEPRGCGCNPGQGTMVVHAVAQQVAIHHLQKM